MLDNHPPGRVPQVLRAEALRIRARLVVSGSDGDATMAFDLAVNALREVGSPYHLAVGLLDYAEHSAANGALESARRLAVEAEAIAERLSAKSLVERRKASPPR